jgi:hypothetical protein
MHKFKNSSSTWKNIEISNVKCHNRILNHNLFTLYTWVFNNLLFYQITRKKVYIPIRLSTLNLTTMLYFYAILWPFHHIFLIFLFISSIIGWKVWYNSECIRLWILSCAIFCKSLTMKCPKCYYDAAKISVGGAVIVLGAT